jgi:xanthine dehydrogenase molybdopterin-binding subunit B
VKAYSIFGATVCEVEVDLLTGQYQVSPAFKFTAVLAYVSFNIVVLQFQVLI